MKQFSINTTRTKSIHNVERGMVLETQLQQTIGCFPLPNYSTLLDQRALYESERDKCTKFRLMLTIAPYCTNVLYNPLTEIFHRNKKGAYSVVTDFNSADKQLCSKARGLTNPTREEMIQNTEYNNTKIGYEYHPGYDIFDNHIFRNKTFKLVNDWGGDEAKCRPVFNTIQDHMRDSRKNDIVLIRRGGIGGKEPKMPEKEGNRHLYIKDDLMSFTDSININLIEENGWWGFANPNKIDTKSWVKKNLTWESLDISKVMNSNKSCEFIDMYPDRSLFSFNPKYNPYTHKPEYNWNVVITYPYKNVYDHELCRSTKKLCQFIEEEVGFSVKETDANNVWTSLKIASATVQDGVSGKPQIYFRSYTKHGLKRNDFIYLYYTIKGKDGTLFESTRRFKVSGVGNVNKKHQDYYFYINDTALFDELTIRETTERFYYADSYRVITPFDEYKKNETISPKTYSLLDSDKKKKCHAEGRKNVRVDNWITTITDENDYFYGLRENGIEERTFYDFSDEDLYTSDGAIDKDVLNKVLDLANRELRFCRAAGDVRSIYYLRKFIKVPNMKVVQRELTDTDVEDIKSLKNYYQTNVVKEEKQSDNNKANNEKNMRLFANEQYQLAFARSIYNDSLTQMVFTDSLNVDKLRDNLGRPLSELYYTFVKNNRGHEAWYNPTPTYEQGNIEYSHCFGVVSSGLNLCINEDDIFEDNTIWQRLGSIWHLANVQNNATSDNPTELPTVVEDRKKHALDYDINYKDNEFFGDLCELNPAECNEYVLCDVMHRFNTAQRETVCNEHYSQLQFHEIISDDYDNKGFTVNCYSAVHGDKQGEDFIKADTKSTDEDGTNHTIKHELAKDYATITRPEGYVYKAHYKIPIREWGYFMSDSHPVIEVEKCKPVQENGIRIEVTTPIAHHLNKGDVLYICDETNKVWCETVCYDAPTRMTFKFEPKYSRYIVNPTDLEDKARIENIQKNEPPEKYALYNNWYLLCEVLNQSGEIENAPTIIIRKKNEDIPSYAMYGGYNSYNWREFQNIGDSLNTQLKDHVFANGYFYVPTHINFFLERQDRYQNTGLFQDETKSFPNDIYPLLKRRSENNVEEPTKQC